MITEVLDIAEENPADYKRIGDDFITLSGLKNPFNVDFFFAMWRQYQRLGIGRIWKSVSDDRVTGVIAALCSPCPFTGVTTISEGFWYVEPDLRGGTVGLRLYKKLEEWAVEIQAARIQMVHLSNNEGPDKIYERLGFKPFETAHIKWLQ